MLKKTLEIMLRTIVGELKDVKGVRAVVLGGSHATGTQSESSDIDIGVYYDAPPDIGALCAAAKALDDEKRDGLVCAEGGWGNWVNCGGWLMMDGRHVDIILRDIARVRSVVESSDRGEFSCHYQTGHPHAYVDVMYRGELAACRVLYAADEEFSALKRHAESYPQPLKKALWDFFSFEMSFSCSFAENYAHIGDPCYITGHAFRSFSAMHQAIFALNEKWLLNEKKAVLRIEGFDRKPDDYGRKIAAVIEKIISEPQTAAALLRALCDETAALVNGEM